MKIKFHFDEQKCTACGACAIACMDQNDVDIHHGQAPYRRIESREQASGTLISSSIACLHCEDAPCAAVCPKDCLYRDGETGLICYDNTLCVGCRACERVCPNSVITFRLTGMDRPKVRMEKCDGCAVRIQAGLTPACTRACPTGALTWCWVE